MSGFQADDLAAVREEGSLVALFTQLAGKTLPQQPTADEPTDEKPPYHIPRPGAWPCGTAASGPTPPPCGSCP
ncbi:hypothetical protein [Streptomyces aurantiogriseus]|uniref:Uncharacterized protein n=1 Tax=Streptomyces aurantiogriseus TaxID=66870 RepID=A0A918FNU6_9ACTN|nr:hypothetical protein [Streptomyces aurantiogriseus]GGR61176.1 hypothetical protein GCM10010251_92370 [Streptomyces aurantiogriseus]